MKVKKNKKMRFSSKSRYFLTLAVLAGLVGNPLLQGTTVLAESFSPDTSLVTGDETQLPDVLNPEIPEIPEILEPEDTIEEKDPSQDEEEEVDVVAEPTPEEKPVPPVREAKPEAAGSEATAENMPWLSLPWEGKIWGDVDVRIEMQWEDNALGGGSHWIPTVLVRGGTITDPQDRPFGTHMGTMWRIIFEDSVDVEGGSLSGLFDLYVDGHSTAFGFVDFYLDIINLPLLDTTGVTDMSYMFRSGMTRADLTGLDTSAVTNMEGMFQRVNFSRTMDLSSFDTSQVTNMRYMFDRFRLRDSGSLSFPPSFDTSQVTDMSGMFQWVIGGSISDLDLSRFNTSKVTDMRNMFRQSDFRTLNLTSFNTEKVTNMSGMFAGTSGLETLDLSSFDTGEVTDMSSMFGGSSWWYRSGLSALDLSMFDTRKVTNMQHMFANMTNLERVNLSSFDTSSVAPGGMNFMFNNAQFTGRWRNVGTGTVDRPNGSHIWTSSELQSTFNGSQADTFVWQPNVPMILGQVEYSYDEPTKTLTLKGGTITNPAHTAWGNVPRAEVEHIVFTGNVNVGGNKSLFNLFGEMQVLETIDNLSYLDTKGVTNMAWMFRGAAGQTNNSRLKALDLSSFDTSSVTNMAMMFHAAIALTELDVSSFDTSKVTDMEDMFSHASSLQEIKGLDSFETENVRDMQGMFRNTAVSQLDVSHFDTGQVLDMNAMFAEMRNIRALDLSSFETSNVRLMTYMFAESRNLEKIDLSKFDTQQVTNMGMMFMHTQSIDKLDLSHFKTENVRDMNHMFAGARDLEELLLDKDNFDTSAVTDMSLMFAHTRNLKSLDLSGFDTRAVKNMTQMFWLADALTELDLTSFDTRNVQANNRTRLFSAINALDELRLGANTVITNSDLPTETTSTGLLNSWKRETQGFEAFTGQNTLFDFGTGPIIENNVLRGPADWLSSQDLMTLSGTAGEATGTWRRVPYQTNVQVKDSSIFIGKDWQPEDNFVSATDRYGETVAFDRITVEGTVDTDTAGTYKVTYTYDGVEETAQITVKAKGGGDDNGTSSGGGSGNDGSESNNGNGEYGTDTSDEDKDNEEQIASDNKEEELTPTHTDNLPRTGEIVGLLLSILGLANLILALTLWLKRRKVK
ncbi:BspA family leucine-rich repeat surface protein [Lactococcus sp. LG1267]|uniref:BspA family leucine-rich repeat surface protein n=1 Tax=Lactococcus sp. LG1267 TaxID=2816910 RepID=UPI001A8D410F|nr:BspA family leucine-rich repeat surface protein [Lactococcus sp. LG1267]QSR03431.1 BspA family leucine-rich repeat surface protein [Lactococcus sp. LG1267]